MTTTLGEALARVTVISPTRRVDLALPGSTTLGELLPNIIRFAGFEGGTSTQEAVHAWVLQRVGEDPLDPNKKVSALNIRDGETLHLRQRESTMPDAAFDDVVDAVTTATSTRPSWVAAHSQWFAVVAMTALLVVVPLMGLWRADLTAPYGGLAEAGLAAFLAIAAAVGSIVLSRAFGRFLPAAGLGWAANILFGAAGLFILPGQPLPLRVLIASAMVLVMAATIWLAARVQPYAHLAVVISALLMLLATMSMVLLNGKVGEVAAVTIALILAATSLLPALSYQLARVAMPNLPVTAEALMADNQPVQSDIVARAISADRVLGAFLTASGVTVVLLMVPLLMRADWVVLALGAAVSVAMMLRARAFVGRTQRLALLLPGAVIGFAVVVMALMALPYGWRLGISAVVVLFGGLALAGYSSSMYNAIMSPTYGRVGDILEWLGIMAIVPLVLAVLDLYLTVAGWAAGK